MLGQETCLVQKGGKVVMRIQTILAVTTLIMLLTSLTVFFIRLRPILVALKQSRAKNRLDRLGERLRSVITQVFGHQRLFQLRLAGMIHLFIFSGFIVLFLDIIESVVKVIHPSFSLGTILGTLVNLWVIIVLIGVGFAFYQRLVLKPKRFEGSNKHDAVFVLSLITVIVTGIVIHNSFFILLAEPVFGIDSAGNGHFLGHLLAQLWIFIGWDTPLMASIGYAIGYFMDIGGVLLFLAYLPGSKHFHVLSAVPSVFLRNLDRKTSLLEDHEHLNEQLAQGLAINDFKDFTWKDILDLFTCTECGRCQDVCPAYASGNPLSPKLLITDLRDALLKQLRRSDAEQGKPIAGEVISEETLWSCTTCRACEEACPVFIEHVPKIVGLRAALVEQGHVEERGQETFEHWVEQGNAYGENPSERPALQKKLGFQFKDARKEAVDWLWFLGDVASFDREPNVFKSIQALSELLKVAELDVGFLYSREVNSGNDALRMGEFGLFEELAKKNMAAMSEASFNRILTSDPHSYNALVNDYPKLGLKQPVYHYTQVLLELLQNERLKIKQNVKARVTYHDACYLGRWNGIFDAPRQIIQLCGAELVEMPRNRENSFCCGAGGGRFWMNEAGIEERPSEARIKEAVELEEVSYFVVSCPKDIVMYTAAVHSLGYEDQIKVIDIAEMVALAVGIPGIQLKAS
jgi:Fe-S oxidoreductase/nitrate reductase gamma subunit